MRAGAAEVLAAGDVDAAAGELDADDVFVVVVGVVFEALEGELWAKADPAGRAARSASAKMELMGFMETESFCFLWLGSSPQNMDPVRASDIGARGTDSYVGSAGYEVM